MTYLEQARYWQDWFAQILQTVPARSAGGEATQTQGNPPAAR